MNKRLFLCSAILLTFLNVSCTTTAELIVPGETEILYKNISSEYLSIADGYMDLKNYKKAADYYKLAMRNKSLKLTAYYKMARCYALDKNWAEAEKAYDYLLKLDPDNTELKNSIAYIHAMKGDADTAVLEYEKLKAENPNNSSVFENYINLLIFLGRAEDAEKQFFEFKEKFPDSTNIKTISNKIAEAVDNPSVDPVENPESKTEEK